MAVIRYGDVLPSNEVIDMEEKLKRRRKAALKDLPPEKIEQTEPKNNETKRS